MRGRAGHGAEKGARAGAARAVAREGCGGGGPAGKASAGAGAGRHPTLADVSGEKGRLG